ncbi:antibiotic biosynthesis monooxygenase [Neiella sp. HB171785]|uniref:Antibiotic biosynthesis monooxygenase n=1 Tax=Neiella litorisoli TaxID=2771431 RepID=A0A8J6QL81_9GAMM|nr:putative quinol monooxygenase [Neiella litorisoli]MBD1391374.1 antibiotic biosynthesis monooxygenase [Neiella litorisoli]
MSSKIYCLAQFRAKPGQHDALFKVLQSLEPDTQREDGCLQYLVTQVTSSEFADGSTDFPIVFNEIWANHDAFAAHCQRSAIQQFFQQQCLDEGGLAEAWNVTVYSDEPNNYDAPRFT